jgi:hypothetical protein
VSLTENQLKALKPKDKSYKIADERGLYVEVSPMGDHARCRVQSPRPSEQKRGKMPRLAPRRSRSRGMGIM